MGEGLKRAMMAAKRSNLAKCATEWCINLVRGKNTYCGFCGGYAHEMPKKDRELTLLSSWDEWRSRLAARAKED